VTGLGTPRCDILIPAIVGTPSVVHPFPSGLAMSISVPNSYAQPVACRGTRLLVSNSGGLESDRGQLRSYSDHAANSLWRKAGYWARFPAAESITMFERHRLPFTISLARLEYVGCPESSVVPLSRSA